LQSARSFDTDWFTGVFIGSVLDGRRDAPSHHGFIHVLLTGKVGIALNGEWYEPQTDSQEDKQSAELAMQFVVSMSCEDLSVVSVRRGALDCSKQKIKVVGLERGPLSLVSTNEGLLDRKVAAHV
jgi:hypothetical protein